MSNFFPGDRFAWLRDNEFARQCLAGVNPVNIELLKVNKYYQNVIVLDDISEMPL